MLWKTKVVSLLVAVILVATFAADANAADQTWDNGGTGNDWGTADNWSTAVPTVSDTATISANGPVAITGTATADTVELEGGQVINQTGGTLTIGTNIKIGYGSGESGTYNLSAGTITGTAAGNGQIQIARDSGSTGTMNITGTGTVDLTGGSGGGWSTSAYVGTYGGVGILNLNSATGMLKSEQTMLGYGGSGSGEGPGTGTLNHQAGTHSVGQLIIGAGWGDNGHGTYNLSGGTLDCTLNSYGLMLIGHRDAAGGATAGVSAMNHTGGAATYKTGVILGNASNNTATYNFNMAGAMTGTMTDGTDDAYMYVRNISTSSGTFQGKGTVDLSGTLENNGKIIANGGTLNMKSFGTVDNLIQNLTTESNGWYAVNSGGRLELPTVAVATGDTNVNWGEAAADSVIDLVNSVQVKFDNVTTEGNLDIALVANVDAPSGTAAPWTVIGVWDITNTDTVFDGADVMFRYDADAVTTETDLRIWKESGGVWTAVDCSVETGNNLIRANDIDSFSNFVVVENGVLFGDADGDWDVDFADFQAVKNSFGTTSGATWADGDFDGDGDVDFADFQTVKNNFGGSFDLTDWSPPAGMSTTPEPATMSVLALGGLALLRRRKK